MHNCFQSGAIEEVLERVVLLAVIGEKVLRMGKVYEKNPSSCMQRGSVRLKTWEEKYLLPTGVAASPDLIEKALNEVGLKDVVVKKHVPPRYLLVEYSPSWVGKSLEIEFLFRQVAEGTEMAIKWPYTRELIKKDETQTEFQKYQDEAAERFERLIEEFKKKLGAIELSADL